MSVACSQNCMCIAQAEVAYLLVCGTLLRASVEKLQSLSVARQRVELLALGSDHILAYHHLHVVWKHIVAAPWNVLVRPAADADGLGMVFVLGVGKAAVGVLAVMGNELRLQPFHRSHHTARHHLVDVVVAP